MKSNIKELYHNSMAGLISNPVYYGLVSIIEIIILALILYKWNPGKVSDKYPVLTTIFMLFVIFIQVLTYLFVENKDILTKKGISIKPNFYDFFIKVIFTLGTLFLIVFGIYISIYLLTNFPTLHTIFRWGIDALIIIAAVAIGYLMIKPVLDAGQTKEGQSTLMALAGNLLLYIPCLFIDLIEWFKYQYSITTRPIIILLGLQGLFLTLRFIIPKLINWYANTSGILLLKDPIYLDKETRVSSYDKIYMNVDKYKYSISAWFWLNPQPPNTRKSYTKFTNILEFGKRPSVEFNALENIFRITCEIDDNKTETIYERRGIPFQKWNNLVINYDGANMDVFLNGDLVASKPNIVPYMTNEDIIVGAKKGLEGGIANIRFNHKILTASQIKSSISFLSSPQPL